MYSPTFKKQNLKPNMHLNPPPRNVLTSIQQEMEKGDRGPNIYELQRYCFKKYTTPTSKSYQFNANNHVKV